MSLTSGFISQSRILSVACGFLTDVAHHWFSFSLSHSFLSPAASSLESRLSTALARGLFALALGFVCRARLRDLLISPTLYAALSLCLTVSSLLVHLQTQYIGK
jgi:hypothetical protein